MSKSNNTKKQLSLGDKEALLSTLKNRFEKNMKRHKGIDWSKVEFKLEHKPDRLFVLNEMEQTGGEPDVVGYDKKADEYTFFDCSTESPKGRRSFCYDPESLRSRKEHKPANSAIGMAEEMGASLMTEEEYRQLQTLGEFDTKTSSWLVTPPEIRKLGGAIFGDRRYNQVFIYHNGAESYYAARGFRCVLKV